MIINRIWEKRWILRSILKTLYFNFHYLPFSQAARIPILLYKPHFIRLKGKIIIEGNVRPGMIILGKYDVSLYPNNGVVYENRGGTIIFNGACRIGNSSFISIGSKATLIFGNNFQATVALKLVSYHHIKFNDNVLCGWNCIFMDTDFHQLTILNSSIKPKSYDKIIIGENCWFAFNNTVMKGTMVGANSVIAGNSILNKDYSNYNYCLLAGQPAICKRENIYRNYLNDHIDY